MRKGLILVLAFLLIISAVPISGLAINVVSVTLNGENISFDVNPIIVNQQVMLPIRAIANAFGVSNDNITYQNDNDIETITIKLNDKVVKITINSPSILIGEDELVLPDASIIEQDRTMVPLMFVIAVWGCNATWVPNADFEGGKVEMTKDVDESLFKIAILFVNELVNGNADELIHNFSYDETVTKIVSDDKFKEQMNSILDSLGECKQIGQPYVQTRAGSKTIVSVPLKFANKELNLNITFYIDGTIGGFVFGSYSEKPEQVSPPDSVVETSLDFTTSKGDVLPGTLTMPKVIEGLSVPCVILVHGSGPNDRDETINQNKPFRDIAWGLAQQGIAVYRYDKRTFVYPEKCAKDIYFTMNDEIVNDAADAVKFIGEIDKIDSKKIYVLGHSQGGYAIPRIANLTSDVAGYIILSGLAQSLPDVMLEQYKYIFNLDGEISDQEQAVIDALTKDIERLKDFDSIKDDEIIPSFGAYKAYLKDIADYNPTEVAKNITKPVLVLQGERDYQVTMTDFNLWKDKAGTKENWSFITYPKLNHLLMSGEGVPNPSEYATKGNVEPKLITDIAQWIKNRADILY